MGASVNNMRMESGTQLQARGVAHNQLENNHGSVRGRTLTKHSDDDDSSDEDLHSRIGLDVEDLACHVRAAYERGYAAGGSRAMPHRSLLCQRDPRGRKATKSLLQASATVLSSITVTPISWRWRVPGKRG